MDGRTAVLVVAVVGVLGGAIGTYFRLKNARGPVERALRVRLSALLWLWVVWMAAGVFLVPRPYGLAVMLTSLPVLLSIRQMNLRLAQARVEDSAGSRAGDGP